MYIKFFGNKKGGSKASVDYLLNNRVTKGTAKILKGDAEFTKAIIGEIKNKQKVTVGSINFCEGETLTDKQKEAIMSDFEKTLCPGMSENQYNILWVEHTDKGRLELNFVIPKIELTTQKSFNPYFHKQDFSRIDLFEDIQNIKYSLASKKDPARKQTLLGEKQDINLVKDYITLDKILHELVQSGDIKNREHLISLLHENNIKVTRTNKDGLSIKLPDSKKAKRFKGSIYNEQFTSITEFKRISEGAERRIKEFHARDTSRELEQAIKKLDRYNKQKAEQNRTKYKQKNDRYTGAKQEEIQSKSLDYSDNIIDNRNNPSRDTLGRIYPEIQRTPNVASTKRNEASARKRKVHQEPKTTVEQRQNNSIYQDRGGIDHDIRAATLRRIRARAKAQRESYAKARKARVELYKTTTANARELRAKSEQNNIELSREYEPIIKQSESHLWQVENIGGQSESHLETAGELENNATARGQIIGRVEKFITEVKKFAGQLKQLILRDNEQRQQQSQSYGHSIMSP